MSHKWPPETMMSGKFPVQKIPFDHPSVSLADQFVYEVLPNYLSATFMRDTTHWEQRPRHSLLIQSSLQNENLPTNNVSIQHLIFPQHFHFIVSTYANHCPPVVLTQQLNVAYGSSVPRHFKFLKLIQGQKTGHKEK